MWHRHFQEAVHQGKRTIHKMFNEGVKLAGQIDSGVQTAKRLYGALSPLIQQIGGQKTTGAIMDVFKGYDQGKAQTISKNIKNIKVCILGWIDCSIQQNFNSFFNSERLYRI